MTRRFRLVTAAMVLCAIAATASAQQYGQWTWDAGISARQRGYEFTESEETVSELQERDGLLSLGVNGYVLHPAIAAFRVGLDTNLTKREGGATLGSRKVGYRGDLRIFPTGAYPVHVYASRQRYDYDDASPAARIGSVPDDITTFGARVRVRSGPLTGLVARAERSRIGLLGPYGGVESHQNQLADWAGGGKGWQHHYRLERQARTFAASRYSTDDVSLLADESYRSAAWQWTSSSQLIRRGWSSETISGSSITALRVQNRFLRTSSRTRTWELQQSSGITLADLSSQSHTLGARYSIATGGNFTVAPFANLGVQTSNSLQVFAPQAGVSATWTAAKGPVSALVSGSAASLLLQTDGEGFSSRDSSVTAGAGASLSFRPRRGLHSQVESYVSRNELRRSGETIAASSVLVPTGGVGTEDRTQARITLGRKWRPFGAHFYVDWVSQATSGELQVNPYSAETLSSSLQVTLRNVNVSMSAGNATLEQNRVQELHFVTAAARVRIARTLSVVLAHREERRSAVGEPEVDGARSEAGLSLRLGSYAIEPQAFVSRQRSGGPERSNRGFTVTIARGFGGVLPIVTGMQRRGVVR